MNIPYIQYSPPMGNPFWKGKGASEVFLYNSSNSVGRIYLVIYLGIKKSPRDGTPYYYVAILEGKELHKVCRYIGI